MTQQQGISEDVLAGRLAKIPPIVDMDSHVVEPPGVWSDRLPARLREAGPRIEYAPAGDVQLVDGKYVETPGTEGPTRPGGSSRETAPRSSGTSPRLGCRPTR
jgi:hypothetical protein